MSTRLSTISQAQEYLLQFSPPKLTGETYTLGRMQALMHRLGDPQDSFKSIHVAGTSGKTSTAYFIRGMLEEAGYKTGLTASPHVVSITERVQIGGKPLPDDTFLRYLNEFLDTVIALPDPRPTYFELLVAFAFFVFAREKVEYAVVEVGVGGLLDATNVITRTDKISVITPIGLDHTQLLGNTIGQIAGQKAGIILPRSQVFTAEQDSEAAHVIAKTCTSLGAVLHGASQPVTYGSLPPFQRRNFALAQQVFEYLAERDGLAHLDEQALRTVTHQMPPGRFETHLMGGKTVTLDGAHNPQKLNAFMEAAAPRIDSDTIWVVALLEAPDDKLRGCADIIFRQPGHFILTEFSVGQDMKVRRGISTERFMKLAKPYGKDCTVEPDAHNALTLALKRPGSEVIITGSLYLVSELRPDFV